MPGTKHDQASTAWLNFILNSSTGGLTGTPHYVGLIDDETAIDYEASDFSTLELQTATESNYTARIGLGNVADWTIADESGVGNGKQATNDNDISIFTATASYTIYGWFITDASSLVSQGNIRYACDLATPVAVSSGNILEFTAGSLKIVEH